MLGAGEPDKAKNAAVVAVCFTSKHDTLLSVYVCMANSCLAIIIGYSYVLLMQCCGVFLRW